MELYVQVMFWIYVVIAGLRAIVICNASYPRMQKTSIGEDVLSLLLGIGFAIWTGVLVFAR